MSPSTIEPRSPMLRKATIGNSFSFSLKKVRAIRKGKAQNFFQCKSCLFAEVSNRSHAGKAVAKFNVINYNYNLSKLSATFNHQNVFNSLTRFAYVKKVDIETEFDIKKFKKESKKPIYRYCDGKEFRERVRKKGFITTNPDPKGIPQGSPISALLSNIYMLDFDKAAHKKIVQDNSGIYRRYCDDILVVCKPDVAAEIEKWVMEQISVNCKLEIQPEKTEKYKLVNEKGDGIYRPINMSTEKRRNIQYLGFEFDGDHIFIRSSSLSRNYRRMKYRVHSAVYDAVKKGGKLFTKKLLLKNTEHGEKIANADYNELAKSNKSLAEKRKFKGNFITYAKRASKKMNDEEKILTQIKPHRKIMKRTIDEKYDLLKKKKK